MKIVNFVGFRSDSPCKMGLTFLFGNLRIGSSENTFRHATNHKHLGKLAKFHGCSHHCENSVLKDEIVSSPKFFSVNLRRGWYSHFWGPKAI